ncbi:MAG: DUF4032 domain-containing protein [Acidobacteriota bacterium]
MNSYKLDYTIERTLHLKPSLEQKFLLDYTGKNFSVEEAEKIWLRVIDHKWYVSERLSRNIGLRVAAVDYLENFYKQPVKRLEDNFANYLRKLFRTAFYSISPSASGKL